MKTALVPGLTDVELLADAERGDGEAFRALVERHASAIHRVAYRMLGDVCEAEDVAQETFLRLWKHVATWRASGSGLPAWLLRVATNQCLDRLRRRGRFDGKMPDEVVCDAPSASSLLDRARVAEIAHHALMALPPAQRAAVVLTYYEELANGAAAEVMAMKVKAFESLLLRGRQALRKQIDRAGLSAADLESWQ